VAVCKKPIFGGKTMYKKLICIYTAYGPSFSLSSLSCPKLREKLISKFFKIHK